MTLETKKAVAAVGSGLAAAVVVTGIVLTATQVRAQGAGLLVGYVLYALTILGIGMLITWYPNMKNYNWGFSMVDGKLRWRKNERVVDTGRTRLVLWPFITLCFELFGLFDFGADLWSHSWMETLKGVFVALLVVLLVAWCVIVMVEDRREAKKNDGRL